jgi:hypothetical protein
MGIRHEAKKGTTIIANGVRIIVLRGSPLLEITAPAEVLIEMTLNRHACPPADAFEPDSSQVDRTSRSESKSATSSAGERNTRR